MNKIKIYRISRSIGKNGPIDSWAINSGIIPKESISMCHYCSSFRENKYDILIQGFEGFKNINRNRKGFLGCNCPLISTQENIVRAVEVLTGVSIVRVGYSEWDQSRIITEEEWFTTQPCLSAMFVDAVLLDIVDINKKTYPICEECGGKKSIRLRSKKGRQCAYPVFESWNGEDVFRLDSFLQDCATIITEEGIRKLDELGMMDLVLEEIEWA